MWWYNQFNHPKFLNFIKKKRDMLAPFNLQKWIDENRDVLKPPIGNKNLYIEAGDFIVMVVVIILLWK